MSSNTDLIYDVKRKMLAKYPRFGSEIAVANIEFKDNLRYHTAATDGKNVYVDPNYFATLSENDRLFTIAHEIMHIKFKHMYRLTDKEGKKRDPKLWNIATDAIINANLERDGFRIKKGYVNIPGALDYSSEELYQKLLQEKEQNEKEQKNNQNQEQENKQNSNNANSEQTENKESDNNKTQRDDHSLWEEAFKELQNSERKGQRQDKNTQKKAQEQEEAQIDTGFDERKEFEYNRKEKREKFKARREKIKKDIRNTYDRTIELGNVGKSKEEIDWKKLIRKEIEKNEMIWSQRRSIAENNYAYRLEENDIEDDAETEVMIDVSGSVDLELVKSFLRQLKPLLQQSKLRVGCFNEQFWGMVDIKNIKEIDNFTIPRGARGHSAWTEDWDLAVRAFTKKREINKIVFTDGDPCPGTMPKEDLKRENIIWLVYGNKNFKPCCGKVINITEKQLEQLHQIDKSSSMEDISR